MGEQNQAITALGGVGDNTARIKDLNIQCSEVITTGLVPGVVALRKNKAKENTPYIDDINSTKKPTIADDEDTASLLQQIDSHNSNIPSEKIPPFSRFNARTSPVPDTKLLLDSFIATTSPTTVIRHKPDTHTRTKTLSIKGRDVMIRLFRQRRPVQRQAIIDSILKGLTPEEVALVHAQVKKKEDAYTEKYNHLRKVWEKELIWGPPMAEDQEWTSRDSGAWEAMAQEAANEKDTQEQATDDQASSDQTGDENAVGEQAQDEEAVFIEEQFGGVYAGESNKEVSEDTDNEDDTLYGSQEESDTEHSDTEDESDNEAFTTSTESEEDDKKEDPVPPLIQDLAEKILPFTLDKDAADFTGTMQETIDFWYDRAKAWQWQPPMERAKPPPGPSRLRSVENSDD